MTADTRKTSDVQPVLEALAAHGHVVTDLVVLTGGYGGTNLRATTPGGALVVKVRPDPRLLRVIHTVSGTLAQRRVPHPVVLLPPTRTSAGWILGLQWVDGRSLDDTPVANWSHLEAAQFGSDLGRWLRQLHAIGFAHRSWRDRAERRFAEKAAQTHEARLVVGGLARQVADMWHEFSAALDTSPMRLIHRDLQPGNLLVEDTWLTGVIDFERAYLADPLYDFVKLEQWVFPLHPGIAPSLRDAYGLDLRENNIRARLAVVSLVEYLSMINYFHKHGLPDLVADQRERLRRLVEQR